MFPPVILYFDGTDYWLGEGYHRVEATRKIERETQSWPMFGKALHAMQFSVASVPTPRMACVGPQPIRGEPSRDC